MLWTLCYIHFTVYLSPPPLVYSPTHCRLRPQAHLLDGIEDVLVNILLRVNGKGVVCGLVVVFEEEVLEGHGVLLLEGHHHLVAEAKKHQLRQDGGKAFKGVEGPNERTQGEEAQST